MAPKLPEGFGKLFELGRLELTAEAVVVQVPWRALFEQQVIDAANNRLRKFARPDLAIP
jgi:hypothetical protein